MGYGEEQRDILEWNKQMKRAIERYKKAANEGNIANKKEESLAILELVDDKIWCGYEIDGIILTEEQIDFEKRIEQAIVGKGKQPYTKPQSIWNQELSQALGAGDLPESLELMQIGRRFGFAKSIKCINENAQYLAKVTSALSKIHRSLDRNEER